MEIGKDHYLAVWCHLDFINVCITSPSRKGLLHLAGADWFLSEIVTLLAVEWFLPAVVRHTLIGGQPVHLPSLLHTVTKTSQATETINFFPPATNALWGYPL